MKLIFFINFLFKLVIRITIKLKGKNIIEIRFLELQKKGFLIGSYSGMKRILKCHPIKILGGSSGFDPVENKKNGK